MSITKRARYGEVYLHYVHRRGYPLEEERKAFNRRFYDLDDDYRKNSRTPISDFHRALKNGVVPDWVRNNPELHRVFTIVANDFRGKYGTNSSQAIHVPKTAATQSVQTQRKEVEKTPINQPHPEITVNNTEERVEKKASRKRTARQAALTQRYHRDDKVTPVENTAIQESVKRDEEMGEKKKKNEADEEEIVFLGWKGLRKVPIVKVKEEKSGVIPVQNVIHKTLITAKGEVIQEDDDLIFLGERRGGQETVEERMAQLERELQAAQRQLLEEKNISSGLMNQILQDKERTIQIILSSLAR